MTDELIERAADSSSPADDGRVDLEYAFWRLASARDKLRIVIALVVGPVRLRLTRAESVPKFRPSWKKTRQKLMALDSEHAKRVVEHDEEADKRLLLRHQTSHSLAPITGTQLLLWIEIGNVEAGKVVGYEGVSLTPEGALNGAAPGSNRPSVGLPRRAGFEDFWRNRRFAGEAPHQEAMRASVRAGPQAGASRPLRRDFPVARLRPQGGRGTMRIEGPT